jgi:hypothetical protein
MHHRESADVLKGFIDEYTAAWNTADLAAIIEAYATPCLITVRWLARRPDRSILWDSSIPIWSPSMTVVGEIFGDVVHN